jgi:hypothetical protein
LQHESLAGEGVFLQVFDAGTLEIVYSTRTVPEYALRTREWLIENDYD